MKHQVDNQGNIALFPTYREMELISKSLTSKSQLRAFNDPLQSHDEIVSMIVCSNEAMILSNKAIHSSRSHNPERSPIIKEKKRTVSQKTEEFLNPTWCTADFEAAHLIASGFTHHITCMKFAEGSPNHPIRVIGMVEIEGRLRGATWDSWGRCNCIELSQAQSGVFDLVKAGERKSGASKFMFYSMVGLVIMYVVALIAGYIYAF